MFSPIIINNFTNKTIKEPCSLETGKKYILVYDNCSGELIEFNEFTKTLPGYVGTSVQTLTHDITGNLIWA